jgi:mono/diheme cytochrome c family protein
MAQSGPAPATTKPDADALPAGPAKEIIQKTCATCHSLHMVTSKRATQDEWNQTINTMIDHGAILSDADADTVLQYLTKNFGPATAKTPADQPAPPDNTPAPSDNTH